MGVYQLYKMVTIVSVKFKIHVELKYIRQETDAEKTLTKLNYCHGMFLKSQKAHIIGKKKG